MYLIRRSAFRAFAKPATSFIKPRSISTVVPAITRVQQQWTGSRIQRRLYSDEFKPSESSAATVGSETSSTEQFSSEEGSSAATSSTSEPTFTETTTAEATTYESVAEPTEQTTVESIRSEDVTAGSGHQPQQKQLYIGNLFFDVTEAQLRNVFEKFGELEDVKIAYDNRGLSRGFGFVTFGNREDATDAIEALNQQVFAGRRMVVQFQEKRAQPGRPNGILRPGLSNLHTVNPPTKTLFIGNMSFEMSDKDLNDLFREVENVLDVRVAIDRKTGAPRGFAHADFVDVESAQKAMEKLTGKEIYGRALRVDFGRDQRPSGNPRDSRETRARRYSSQQY